MSKTMNHFMENDEINNFKIYHRVNKQVSKCQFFKKTADSTTHGHKAGGMWNEI